MERERYRNDLQDEEAMKRYRNKERAYIETKLSKYLPVIIETNLMALELKRNILLSNHGSHLSRKFNMRRKSVTLMR